MLGAILKFVAETNSFQLLATCYSQRLVISALFNEVHAHWLTREQQ